MKFRPLLVLPERREQPHEYPNKDQRQMTMEQLEHWTRSILDSIERTAQREADVLRDSADD